MVEQKAHSSNAFPSKLGLNESAVEAFEGIGLAFYGDHELGHDQRVLCPISKLRNSPNAPQKPISSLSFPCPPSSKQVLGGAFRGEGGQRKCLQL